MNIETILTRKVL